MDGPISSEQDNCKVDVPDTINPPNEFRNMKNVINPLRQSIIFGTYIYAECKQHVQDKYFSNVFFKFIIEQNLNFELQ